MAYSITTELLVSLYMIVQILYTMTFAVELYFFTRPVNWVDMSKARSVPLNKYPYIVLFYPVLNELEETMRTTMSSIAELDYPLDRYRVIAIPNRSDRVTIERLRKIQEDFVFLEIIEVPPCDDASWQRVWEAWDENPNAYWWHEGDRAFMRNLPPKKNRQLIYSFYLAAEELMPVYGDFAINYIDADSCPPRDHFMGAAVGLQHYDVLQSTNVAGNLLKSLSSSWHAFDHMAWDGLKYPHLSANGKHPYWVLGKGLFFKASDLLALGSFHPWMAIEDPEIGMRFWKAGKKLGILKSPLIEEVPETFAEGVNQRRRWVCGFFESLTEPLSRMHFSLWEKFRAWLNFAPCLSLWLNIVGLPTGVWALWNFYQGADNFPVWLVRLSVFNILCFLVVMTSLYVSTWKRTALVLERKRDRIWYMLRVNPLFVMIWWVLWLRPLWIGFRMYLQGSGLVWDRTKKIDANHELIASRTGRKAGLR